MVGSLIAKPAHRCERELNLIAELSTVVPRLMTRHKDMLLFKGLQALNQ